MQPSYRVVTGAAPGARGARPSAVAFSRSEWLRLAALYGAIALLHVAGVGLYLYYSSHHPTLVGLGFVAYMFGMRHAFDADHIAAVDDTVRYMLQKGERPLAVGFFFSLGHSTIVVALSVAIIVAASVVREDLAVWQSAGSVVGATVSGTFLWVIGILNVVVLLDILKVWREADTGKHSHAHLEELLAGHGLMGRLFGGRLRRLVSHSWQMYPLGMLFGLGFDTASEIGLLVMTAGAATGNIPVAAVLALPLLFAAGMSALDTTDGVLMAKAYDWAFVNPLRKIFYNITITSLSIVVALLIGTVELLQVLVRVLGLAGPFAEFVTGVDFGMMGYAIVAFFLAAWMISVAIWKLGRFDQRYEVLHPLHSHPHSHDGRIRHAHRHFH